jgi:hypothetical protein
MIYFDHILEAYKLEEMNISIEEYISQAEAIFSEADTTEQNLPFMSYIDTVKGVDIYFCTGTDSYHFVDYTQSNEAYFNFIGSIQLSEDDIQSVPNSGPADEAIKALRLKPEIIEELREIDPLKLIEELKEYGAWDDEELSNHDDNLDRILWCAVNDIKEDKSAL